MFLLTYKGVYHKLGNTVYYNEEHDIYVLANSKAEAREIVDVVRTDVNELEQLWRLTPGDSVLHKGGILVYVTHRNTTRRVYTNLVFGTPKGVDSTKSLKVVYNAPAR